MLFSGSARSVRAQAADSEEVVVRNLDNQERLAVLNSDRVALERLWSENLAVNAPTNRVNVGRQAVLDIVARGGMHYSVFDRKVEAVRIDGDVAIVMGSETVAPVATASVTPTPTPRRFTNIWKKELGTWRMIARHANVVPSS